MQLVASLREAPCPVHRIAGRPPSRACTTPSRESNRLAPSAHCAHYCCIALAPCTPQRCLSARDARLAVLKPTVRTCAPTSPAFGASGPTPDQLCRRNSGARRCSTLMPRTQHLVPFAHMPPTLRRVRPTRQAPRPEPPPDHEQNTMERPCSADHMDLNGMSHLNMSHLNTKE